MLEEDEEILDIDEEAEAEEPAPPEAEAPTEEPEADASLEEILSKKPEDRPGGDEEDDEDSILALGREERVEPLAVKVIPQQPTEFTCRSCYLVKHRSQLADRERMFCRDCA